MSRAPLGLLAASALWAAACQEHEFHPPDRDAQVAAAESAYASVDFDTVTWSSDTLRVREGNTVFAAHCARCHGPLGRGESEYAREQELEVPSLVEADWPLAGDLDAVRRRIYAGHPAGMPTWGVARLEPREVDAVAFYIVRQLRPEVLGGG